MRAIVFAVLIVLVIAGGVVAYILIELPEKSEIADVNINIGAQEETGYVIFSGENELAQGETEQDSYVQRSIANQSVRIANKNIKGQGYYTSYRTVDNPEQNNRIDLELVYPGNVTITQEGSFPGAVNLTFTAQAEYRNMVLCFEWTSAIVGFSINESYEETNRPDSLKDKVDRCYGTGVTLMDNNMTVGLSYSLFGAVTNDFIKVYAMDSDEVQPGMMLTEVAGEGVGGENVIYKLG